MNMYTDDMQNSIKKVIENRKNNIETEPKRMTAEQKKDILNTYHPEYKDTGFKIIKIGPNKNEKSPTQFVQLLHSKSKILGINIDLSKVDYDVDVLIIGGGGAGASAAIEAHKAGATTLIATKLRMGDSNTIMAEGGIQAANKENDSPRQHFIDAFGGGHFNAKRELLKSLVMDGPLAISWLSSLGMMFDKQEDGTMITTHGGGTSRKRMHAAKDVTGAEIARVLRDEVKNLKIPVVEHTAAIELIKDDNGNAAGAILLNTLTGQYMVAKSKTVIIATGGSGRMHYHGFPTSNHYGATADGLVMAYRAGAKLMHHESIQYHPTGTAWPPQIYGALITEKTRAIGAMMVNVEGNVFCHPLETRDVASAAIIRETQERKKGLKTTLGQTVWLDTPMIDIKNGQGFLEKRIPGMMHMFLNYGIDPRQVPILIYPTFHYQNGGIDVEKESHTKTIPNLYAAGEVAGGIHGTNRLMGNSLLDIIVFGRIAGKNAASQSKTIKIGNLSLQHVNDYANEIDNLGIDTGETSPLLYPKYARDVSQNKNEAS